MGGAAAPRTAVMPTIMAPRRLFGAAVLETLEESRAGLQRAAERDPPSWTIYPYSLRGEHFSLRRSASRGRAARAGPPRSP